MEPILFEAINNIGFITLNRPEKLNAFNREMALLLQHKLDECAASPEVRCVYITGSGKGFSAGQDLAEVVVGGRYLRQAKQRLVPLHAGSHVRHANVRPQASHRSSPPCIVNPPMHRRRRSRGKRGTS